jgi:predicted dinucleotide-binding enzyme
MSIGIIGAGNIGGAIAAALARNGIAATLANRSGPERLAPLIVSLGGAVTAGTVEQAAAQDIVFVAVPWSNIPDALAGLDLRGKIVVDANNAIEAPHFQPIDLGGRTSSQAFAELVPGAKVVKAFNHLQPQLLSGDPRAEGGTRVLFYSGDDAEAKAKIGALIAQIGFFGIDVGTLAIGSALVQFPGGPLPGLNLAKFG